MQNGRTKRCRFSRHVSAAALLLALGAAPAFADAEAAKKWVDSEFQPSTLSKEDQMKEMEWFIKAAEPFKGMEINVLSEAIPTHTYESKTLTKAFEEITGIKVNHQLLGEGEVVQAVQTQMQTNRNLYDAYINDSDLIGTHSRLQSAVNLTDWMAGEGKDVTLPTLDIDDFIGKSFTTGPDGKLWQLPDQQFANLYWFRKDWFDRADLKEKFKAKYGYELGVPVNWSAYEDIADFFTNDVKEIDGVKVYGHMDYGKRAPDLGWRMTDAWLSMAGAGSPGLPNGRPDRRMGHPHGRRTRATRPALRCRAAATRMARPRSMPSPSGTSGCANMRLRVPPTSTSISRCRRSAKATSPSRSSGTRPSLPRWWRRRATATTPSTTQGTPLWRMAPSPHGVYWKEGQKLGYQDAGSWTLFKSTPVDRAKAAWLYAQFVVSKTVSLKKSHVGLTIIRDSDIKHQSFTERAPKLGGLVEFYRSPDRVAWTPTGINVPDYPKLAQLWWQQIGDVNSGAFTPQEAMDRLAGEMDQIMARMQAADEANKTYGGCGPRLNPEKDPSEWLGKEGGPHAKLENEKEQGQTDRL